MYFGSIFIVEELPDDGVVDVDGGDHHECEGGELYPGPQQPLQQPPRPPHRGRLPREHLPVQVGRAQHLDQHLAGEHATMYLLKAFTLSVSMSMHYIKTQNYHHHH